MLKSSFVLLAALGASVAGYAQEDTARVEARVNAILSALTLAEKLDYISGENFGSPQGVFNIKPIARLGSIVNPTASSVSVSTSSPIPPQNAH